MKQYSAKQRSAGLTLIEVMVAISLFIVLMSAVSSSLPNLFKLNRQTTAQANISTYAKNTIDYTRAYWLTPNSAATSDQDRYPNLTAGTLPPNMPAARGVSCLAPQVTEVARVTAPISSSLAPVYWTSRRKITVQCRPEGSTSTYTSFVAEVGRPE